MADERQTTGLDKRIGARIRARRLEIEMSQEQLAELLGVTFQQVQKYEKGVNRVAASRLYDISEALDMPIQRFFEEARMLKNGKAANGIDSALILPGALELIKLYAEIDSVKVRRRVLELVRAMGADR